MSDKPLNLAPEQRRRKHPPTEPQLHLDRSRFRARPVVEMLLACAAVLIAGIAAVLCLAV